MIEQYNNDARMIVRNYNAAYKWLSYAHASFVVVDASCCLIKVLNIDGESTYTENI